MEELWPQKSIGDRLGAFLEELQQKILEKEKKDKWFDLRQIGNLHNTNFQEKTEIMHKLNTSYPGWIFLPWKMKGKTKYVLRGFENMHKFDDVAPKEQINYMYEYVKLMDISGRPIFLQVAKKYWDILKKNNWDDYPEKLRNELKYKVQIVYLHLLRSYRELADWKMYDECHERIDSSCLDYDGKQFFYACDCWSNLFRFRPEDLTDMLEKWELAAGDMYWPLIKASMYALMGETSKADEILMKTLVLVRRQLVKRNGNEYLSSIEESIVSLINFIRQGNHKFELEECINEGEISWWNENDKYCLHLNVETKMRKNIETNNNYDLSFSYTTYVASDNSDIFYALEYLRFLEQTGHPFRLQNVTNTKGLHCTVKKLAPYYPHWCLMQILIAQEKNLIDSLFGRVKLSGYTRREIDSITKEYISVFQTVIKNVKPKKYFLEKSVYEQSAVVLPEIISRFCYKCSVGVLDEILNITLELCISNVRTNFKKLNKLLEGVLSAYTTQEQGERINKILEFPIVIDILNDYYDPVYSLRKPKKKYILDSKVYNRVILQIKQALENGGRDEKEAANNRLLILEQVIELHEEEKALLCSNLEKQNTLENKYMLYHIEKQKYKQKIREIFEDTMDRMKGDTNTGMFTVGSENYGKLIDIIEDVNILDVNIIEVFEIMKELVETSLSWISNEQLVAKERVQQSFLIALGLLVLCKKGDVVLKIEEKGKIRDYFGALEQVYGKSFVFKIVLSYFSDETKISAKEIKTAIWLANNDEIGLLRCLYDILWANKYEIKADVILSECTVIIFEAITYKMINSKDKELESILLLLYSLLKNDILVEDEIPILDASLLKLVEDTCIDRDVSEQNALSKLKCRIKTCQIAKELYSKDIETEAISKWKLISQNEDEFIELRLIDFE